MVNTTYSDTGRYSLSIFAVPGKFDEGASPKNPWTPEARRRPSHVKHAVMVLRDPQGKIVKTYDMASGGLRTSVGGWNAIPGLVHGGPPFGINWNGFSNHGGAGYGYRDGKPGHKGEQGFWLPLINSAQADAEKGSAFGIHPTRLDGSMGCVNFLTGDEGRDFYKRMSELPVSMRPAQLHILPPQHFNPDMDPKLAPRVAAATAPIFTAKPEAQGWSVKKPRFNPPA
jgi:hypothetical protein